MIEAFNASNGCDAVLDQTDANKDDDMIKWLEDDAARQMSETLALRTDVAELTSKIQALQGEDDKKSQRIKERNRQCKELKEMNDVLERQRTVEATRADGLQEQVEQVRTTQRSVQSI